MTIDQAREYVVIVNGGSGCIMQPMSDEYAYVLTAKHNIEKGGNTVKEIIHFIFSEGHWLEKTIPIDKFELLTNYFPHQDKDIAIIKIPVQSHLTDAFSYDELASDKDDYYLMGYPELRRKENQNDKKQWFRRDIDVQIVDPRESGVYEGKLSGNENLEEVMGQSGGCFCKVIGEKLFVAGIQNAMAVRRENMGRVRFTAIQCFEEIIKSYPEVLAPILPCYMKSFDFLRGDAFKLQEGLYDENIKHVKAFLRAKIDEVIKNAATPSVIKELFEQRLLFFNEVRSTLQSKKIWIIWLEFLTILNIVKQQGYSRAVIETIFNEARLLCSDTNKDWSKEFNNIIYADYKGLPKGATVIIGTSTAPRGDTFKLDRKIMMIDRVVKDEKSKVDKQLLQIDEGVNFPLTDYEFIHIAYFKEGAIINKHSDYAAFQDDEAQILEKLKKEYQELKLNE